MTRRGSAAETISAKEGLMLRNLKSVPGGRDPGRGRRYLVFPFWRRSRAFTLVTIMALSFSAMVYGLALVNEHLTSPTIYDHSWLNFTLQLKLGLGLVVVGLVAFANALWRSFETK